MISVAGVAFALISAILWSLNSIVVRFALTKSKVNVGVLVSTLVGALVFGPAFIHFHASIEATFFLILAALFTLIGRTFEFEGINRIGAAKAVIIRSSNPLFGILFAVLLLEECITLKLFIGIILIVGGVMLVSAHRAIQASESGGFGTTSVLFPLGAAIFFAASPVAIKAGLNLGAETTEALAVSYLCGLLMFLPYAVWKERGLLSIERRSLLLYIISGMLICTALFSFYNALELADASVVIALRSTSPLFVVLLSYLMLRQLEQVTRSIVLSGGLVFLGTLLLL